MPERFKISIDYYGGELHPEEREEWWDDRYLYVTARRVISKDDKPFYESVSVSFPEDVTPERIVQGLRVMAMQQREADPVSTLRLKQIADQVAQNDLGADVDIDMPPAEQS